MHIFKWVTKMVAMRWLQPYTVGERHKKKVATALHLLEREQKWLPRGGHSLILFEKGNKSLTLLRRVKMVATALRLFRRVKKWLPQPCTF